MRTGLSVIVCPCLYKKIILRLKEDFSYLIYSLYFDFLRNKILMIIFKSQKCTVIDWLSLCSMLPFSILCTLSRTCLESAFATKTACRLSEWIARYFFLCFHNQYTCTWSYVHCTYVHSNTFLPYSTCLCICVGYTQYMCIQWW